MEGEVCIPDGIKRYPVNKNSGSMMDHQVNS